MSEQDPSNVSPWELPKLGHAGNQASSLIQAPQITAEELESIQETARKEAHDQGYQEGLEQGLKAGQALIQKQVQQFTQIINTLDEPLDNLDARIEQELAELAIQIARQLIRREIKVDTGQIIAVVREAIGVLPSSSQNVTLQLHPEDAELVRSALAIDAMETRWKILEDPVITRGGCQVFSDTSRIDATIENRLTTVIAQAMGDERQRS